MQEYPQICPFANPQHRCSQAQPISGYLAPDTNAAVIAPADGFDMVVAELPAGGPHGEAGRIVRHDVAAAAAAGVGDAEIDASPGRGVAGTGGPPSGQRPSGTATPAAVDAS